MKKLPLILIGGGGHCKSCIDVIEQEEKYEIKGILDSKELKGTLIGTYQILGNDDLLPELILKGYYFLIAIGQIKSAVARKNIFDLLKRSEANIATVISPRAYVSNTSIIGKGTIVLHGTIINAYSEIGNNCIINSMSLIEHDAKIGDHVHISTGALINGACTLGNNCFIGSRSVIINNTTISDDIIIGAGSVVVSDILSPGTYVGNPAKKLKDE